MRLRSPNCLSKSYSSTWRFSCVAAVAWRRAKVSFANTKEEAHAALAPHISDAALYESLGGERPDTAYDPRRYERFMRGLDAERRAALSAAALSSAKGAAGGGGAPLADGNTLHADCH